MMNENWRDTHFNVIGDFLNYLNGTSNKYVLKGGTALMMCYGLDRFSEDIDLNSTDHGSITKIISDFCCERGYEYRIAKDTDTVKRFFVNYGNIGKPLKIEISYREKSISEENCTEINGIKVYDIDNLAMMKGAAYQSRDKLRDLYDVCFICNNYLGELKDYVVNQLKINISMKGIDQFDYIINTQQDELIDNDKLAEDFLKMYDVLGLLMDEQDRSIFGGVECENEEEEFEL